MEAGGDQSGSTLFNAAIRQTEVKRRREGGMPWGQKAADKDGGKGRGLEREEGFGDGRESIKVIMQ